MNSGCAYGNRTHLRIGSCGVVMVVMLPVVGLVLVGLGVAVLKVVMLPVVGLVALVLLAAVGLVHVLAPVLLGIGVANELHLTICPTQCQRHTILAVGSSL